GTFSFKGSHEAIHHGIRLICSSRRRLGAVEFKMRRYGEIQKSRRGSKPYWDAGYQPAVEGQYQPAVSGTWPATAASCSLSSESSRRRFELPHELGRLQLPFPAIASSVPIP